MPDGIERLLIGIIGSVAVSLLTLYVLQRRLCCVAKHFSYSELSTSGITIALTVLNRGHRPEKEIELQFDPKRSYSLIAASIAGIKLTDNVLSIARLPKWEDINVLLLIERGDFSDTQILHFTSEHAKGRIYSGLDKVPPPPGAAAVAFLAILAMFALFALAGYRPAVDYLKDQARIELKDEATVPNPLATGPIADPLLLAKSKALLKLGWRSMHEFVQSPLGQNYAEGEFPVALKRGSRKGDIVTINVDLWNKTSDWLTASVSLGSTSQQVQSRLEGGSPYTGDILISAGARKTQSLALYLPAKEEQIIAVTTFLTSADGDMDVYRGIFTLDK
jgi:hypothetical protein